nr:MAG TPA: hypothetical protein [Bacteriophage sp.]
MLMLKKVISCCLGLQVFYRVSQSLSPPHLL